MTLKDLARELDLSPSTVARALSDHPHIASATKARVQQVAESRGYAVHLGARLMRNGRSTLIGLLVPDVQNYFYATVAKAMAQCCHERGFQLVLGNTEDDADNELAQLRGLREARAAGVIIVPSARPAEESVALLRRMRFVQLVRTMPGLEKESVFRLDDRGGLFEATDHLIALGHRRIAYIGGTLSLSTGSARFAGFRDAMEAAGLQVDDDLLAFGAPRAGFATDAFEAMWARPNRPTALVAGGSRITVGLLEAVTRLKVPVPEQLSLVGHGDAPWFSWWRDGLTTLALPVRDIALGCGEFLLRRIREEPEGEPPHSSVHAPRLVVRSSTTPPPDGVGAAEPA
ncbi:MAG: LacI family DNA-binding transcriptional regulator [Hyphomicrobiales bacterium]